MGDFGPVFTKCIFYGYDRAPQKIGFYLSKMAILLNQLATFQEEKQRLKEFTNMFFPPIPHAEGALSVILNTSLPFSKLLALATGGPRSPEIPPSRNP